MVLTIRVSKNDRAGRGAQVFLTNESKDGISLLSRIREIYDLRRRQLGTEDGPLFSSWNMDHQCLSNSPLSSGQALADRLRAYLSELRQRYPHIALNPNSYGMHSLRRGGTVAAWAGGMDIEKLKAHGRWRSDAIKAYLTASIEIKLSVTLSM
jgi:hypothetical protein